MKFANVKYLGFNDFWLFVLGVPIVGFLMPLLFFGHTLRDGFLAFLPAWLMSIVHSFFYWSGARVIMIQLRKILYKK